MDTSILNVRVDVNDKKDFEQFCNSAGMDVSTAINMFIRVVLREQEFPFEIDPITKSYIKGECLNGAISDIEFNRKLDALYEKIMNMERPHDFYVDLAEKISNLRGSSSQGHCENIYKVKK